MMETITIDTQELSPDEIELAIKRYKAGLRATELLANIKKSQQQELLRKRKIQGKRTRIVNHVRKMGIPVNPRNVWEGSIIRLNVNARPTYDHLWGKRTAFGIGMPASQAHHFEKYINLLKTNLSRHLELYEVDGLYYLLLKGDLD